MIRKYRESDTGYLLNNGKAQQREEPDSMSPVALCRQEAQR